MRINGPLQEHLISFLVPVIPQTGLPGGGGLIPGAGKKASKLPGLKKKKSSLFILYNTSSICF